MLPPDARDDLDFVRKVVMQEIQVRNVPSRHFDDLVGAGAVAMVRARQSFDGDRGVAFSQYAAQRIKWAALDEMRLNDLLPRNVRRDMNQRGEAFHATVSLDLIEEAFEWPSADHSPETLAVASIETEGLYAAIHELPDRQRTIITRSLAGDKFYEIAQELQVTESRISQLYKDAAAKLRTLLARPTPPTPRGATHMTTPPIQTLPIQALMARAAASPTARTRRLGEQLAQLLDELEQRFLQESEAMRLQREIDELEKQLAEKRAKLPQTTQRRASHRVPAGSRPRNGVCPDCGQTGLGNVGVHRSKAHGWVKPDRVKKSA